MLSSLRLLVLIAMVIAGLSWWLFKPVASVGHNFTGLQGDVQRGAYLARLSGCFACHTDYTGGGEVFAGGGPITTAFGTFFAPNITTDKENGIGQWTLAEFAKALTKGISPDGEHYFPVFPYENYRYFSDQDIIDLWAAFKTVPPVESINRDHQIDFPFNQRFLLAPWKTLYFQDLMAEFAGLNSESLARGAYIVNGPGHCVSCHTPRSVFGGLQLENYLAGGEGPDQQVVPAITAIALRTRDYSVEDIAFLLKDGITPDGDVLGGSMAEIIKHNTRWLTQDDRKAIAEFLLR